MRLLLEVDEPRLRFGGLRQKVVERGLGRFGKRLVRGGFVVRGLNRGLDLVVTAEEIGFQAAERQAQVADVFTVSVVPVALAAVFADAVAAIDGQGGERGHCGGAHEELALHVGSPSRLNRERLGEHVPELVERRFRVGISR